MAELGVEHRESVPQMASEVRQARQELLDDIRAGRSSVAAVLECAEHDPVVAKTRVVKLVQAVPGFDRVKAAMVLAKVGVAEGRRVAGLSPGQARALARELG